MIEHSILHLAAHAIYKPIRTWMIETLGAPAQRGLDGANAAMHKNHPTIDPAPTRPVRFHLQRRWSTIGALGVILWAAGIGCTFWVKPGDPGTKGVWFFVYISIATAIFLFPGLVTLWASFRTQIEITGTAIRVRDGLWRSHTNLDQLTNIFMIEPGFFGPRLCLELENERHVNVWGDVVNAEQMASVLAYHLQLNNDRRAAERAQLESQTNSAIAKVAATGSTDARRKLLALNPLPDRPVSFRQKPIWVWGLTFSVIVSLLLIYAFLGAWERGEIDPTALLTFQGMLIGTSWLPTLVLLPNYLRNYARLTETELIIRTGSQKWIIPLHAIRDVGLSPDGSVQVHIQDRENVFIPSHLRNLPLLMKALDFHVIANAAIELAVPIEPTSDMPTP